MRNLRITLNEILTGVPSDYISFSIENGKYIVRYKVNERSNTFKEKVYDNIDSCIHKLKLLTHKF